MTDKPHDFYTAMRNVIEGYKALAAYVEAIPADVVLPTMPGVDRDFYDAQADNADAELARLAKQEPVRWEVWDKGYGCWNVCTEKQAKEQQEAGLHARGLYAAPVPAVAAPASSKCAGCNGHGMLGNGHPDCGDVECHFCDGTGTKNVHADTAPEHGSIENVCELLKAEIAKYDEWSRFNIGSDGRREANALRRESLVKILNAATKVHAVAAPADLLNKLSIVLSGEMVFDPPAHLVDAIPETWDDWDKSIYKKYLREAANSWGRRKIIMQARALLQSAEGDTPKSGSEPVAHHPV